MTQVDPERDVGQSAPDALSRPFTPGAPSNDLGLASFPETVAGPVPVELTDRRTAEFVEQWRNASYNCYSSGHKFCREVCPVMQVTRNESWTPTAFHANVVAMEKGELEIADIAADYVNCTQCDWRVTLTAPSLEAATTFAEAVEERQDALGRAHGLNQRHRLPRSTAF